MAGGTTIETRVGAVFGVLSTAAILVLTLRPEPQLDVLPKPACYLCDGIQLSDAVRNLVLFVPLGASLQAMGVRGRWAVALALSLSATIEYLQLTIPGRESSLGDLLCNGAGAFVGFAARLTRNAWLRAPAATSAWLSLAAACAVAIGVVVTGWLLSPAYTPQVWYAGWVPELGYLGLYLGYVQDVRIGDVPLPGGRLADTDAVRELLRAGAPLRVRAVAGPEPERLSPLVTIHDAERREMLIVGAESGDLIYRQRTHAADLGLEQPAIRVPGALAAPRRGMPLDIEVMRPDHQGLCVVINGARRCGLGYSVGRGWALFFALRDVAWGGRRILDSLWIAALAFPVALWWRPRGPGFAAAALIVGAILLLPPAVGLVAPRRAEAYGLAIGLLLGMGCQRALRPPD